MSKTRRWVDGVVTNGETFSLGTGEAVAREGCLLIAWCRWAGPGGGARESHTVRAVRTFSGVQQDLTNDLTRLWG